MFWLRNGSKVEHLNSLFIDCKFFLIVNGMSVETTYVPVKFSLPLFQLIWLLKPCSATIFNGFSLKHLSTLFTGTFPSLLIDFYSNTWNRILRKSLFNPQNSSDHRRRQFINFDGMGNIPATTI